MTINSDAQVSKDGTLFVGLRFAGGLNTSLKPEEINSSECADGSENFDLGLDVSSFQPRKPLDLKATATNALEIRGFVELIKSDGTVTCLVQAGSVVYKYDGVSTFTEVGTCNANSRLRGSRHSTSVLDDYVLISDLEKLTPVSTWDGTTFAPLNHDLTGDFFAKYILVDKERALYFNVTSNGVDTPHAVVASARTTGINASAVGTLTTANRPSSSLGAGDPWFLVSPDLRPINGATSAFGEVVFSTEDGSLWRFSGSDSTDFALDELYSGSGAAGREPVTLAGNDVLYGRPGAVESVLSSIVYGDVMTDDVSRWISPDVKDVEEWERIVFNPRLHRAYCWPKDGNEVWVLEKSIYDQSIERARRNQTGSIEPGLSPWMKWTTDFGNGDFRVTAAMLIRDPADGKDKVWAGTPDGEVLEMEGLGSQDAGSDDVVATRVSGRIRGPWLGRNQTVGADLKQIRGYVDAAKRFGATLNLKARWSGTYLNDQSKTLALDGFSGITVYGGTAYYGGTFYYGTEFEGRPTRQEFSIPGQSSHFQLEASVTGSEFDLHEIGIQAEIAA